MFTMKTIKKKYKKTIKKKKIFYKKTTLIFLFPN